MTVELTSKTKNIVNRLFAKNSKGKKLFKFNKAKT